MFEIGAGFSYGRIILLGFGFLSITLCWSLFNAYVPIFLRQFVGSSAVVGVIMILDNVAGMTLQPWFGGMSDRVRTRYGRRLPFLMVGMPLAAAAFPLLPLAPTLGLMILAIIMYDFAMSLFRAPTIALMPDLTPEEKRSQANGIINVMGGLGGLLALFAGAWLYRKDPALPFWAGAGVLLLSLGLIIRVIREPDATHAMTSEYDKSGGVLSAALRLPQASPQLLWTLLALFGWSLGQSSIETFFTTYAVLELGWDESTGAILLGFFALAYLLCAVPAGILGARWGQHTTMARGVAALVLIAALAPLFRTHVAVGALLAVGGVAWAFVVVNAYPRVVQLGSDREIGVSTGLYYFFTSLAASVGPPVAGSVMDLLGEASLFGFSAVAFLGAWLCLRRAARATGAAQAAAGRAAM